MTFDFNRLASITYPLFPDKNVTYVYGAAGDADAKARNQLGRIAKTTHQAGVTEQEYGKLGEVLMERRTFLSARGKAAERNERVKDWRLIGDRIDC